MTICELINEREEIMRIEYWDDGKVDVKQSYGYSIMYGLKMQEIEKHYPSMPIREVQQRTNIWIESYKNCHDLNRGSLKSGYKDLYISACKE